MLDRFLISADSLRVRGLTNGELTQVAGMLLLLLKIADYY